MDVVRRALVATVAVVVVSGSSAVAAGSLPKLATGAVPGYAPLYAVRPHTIWFTGDSTGIIGRIARDVPAAGKRPGFLHWKTWTRERAYGVGTLWYRSGGGAGRFQRYPVAITITLTDPRAGHFVKMTLHEGSVVDMRCNPPGITYWTLPRKPGSTSCRGARP